MDKLKILEFLKDELSNNLNTFIESALSSKEMATNEDSKAENKYDTRGLEASYLASGSAQRAQEIKKEIQLLNEIQLRSYTEEDTIGLFALVSLENEDNELKHYFILPCCGGSKVSLEGQTIVIISHSSPLAQSLMGKKLGDEIDHKINNDTIELLVKTIQ